MELQIDMLVDEDYPFENQPFCSSSSSGSFSSASTSASSHVVFTPPSGRSTPALPHMLMEHEPMASSAFDLTPPPSTFGGYYPETKSELHRYHAYESLPPATPSRKTSVQPGNIDFDFAHIMGTPPAGNQTQPVTTQSNYSHYPYANRISSPPLSGAPPPYPDHLHFDVAPTWPWPGDASENIFDRHDSPGMLMAPLRESSLRESSLRDRSLAPPAYYSNSERRHIAVNDVQQKTTALQRAQARRSSKRKSQKTTTFMGNIQITKCERGRYNCSFEGCRANSFKRQEHMKRHMDSVHGPQSTWIECPFCPPETKDNRKRFNRMDNFRSHLKLHTTKTGRTKHVPEAGAYLDGLMLETRQRSTPKRKIKTEKTSP